MIEKIFSLFLIKVYNIYYMENFDVTKAKITDRDEIKKYLEEIGGIGQITPEEEVKLAKQIRQGNQKALDKLTKANLRFVVSVAKKYQNQGLSLPDLIQEGNLGLIKAAQRFDETKNVKFISHAVHWIRQSIRQALTEQSRLVRIPGNKIADENRIKKIYSAFEQEHEREPSTEELAELLEIEEENVSNTLGISTRHVSLDAPLSKEENSGTLLDTTEDKNIKKTDNALVRDESLRIEIDRALKTLPFRQRAHGDMFRLLFGIGTEFPMSPEDVADRYGLTAERVRQIEDEVLVKIKGNSRLKKLLGQYSFNKSKKL